MAEPGHVHKSLRCGIELAALPLANRRAVAVQIRYLVGFANEPAGKLGLNHLVEQTICKGTAQRSGQALSDAFDALGVRWASWAGRESTGYQFTCLPEFLDRALELHAEFLCTPTFPEDALQVATQNHVQEINHIADDPHELSAKLLNRQVYGPLLGRHVLGEPETLRSITPGEVRDHWQRFYHGGRMQVAIAGPVDPDRVAAKLDELFDGYGSVEPAGREAFPHGFEARFTHHAKQLQQEHIGICYPGASLSHPLRYAQQAAIGVLSGGMSARLFTEVREKQGLVYWVTASTEHPRGIGIVYLGASTTPERCDQTYRTLLREIDRLGEDLEESELQRSINGIVARAETRGDVTRAWCNEMSEDLFHHRRLVPRDEKIARVRAVTLTDVRKYLESFPRHTLSVLTVGPKELDVGGG